MRLRERLVSHCCVHSDLCALSPLVICGTARLPLGIVSIVVTTQRKRVCYTSEQQLVRAVKRLDTHLTVYVWGIEDLYLSLCVYTVYYILGFIYYCS